MYYLRPGVTELNQAHLRFQAARRFKVYPKPRMLWSPTCKRRWDFFMETTPTVVIIRGVYYGVGAPARLDGGAVGVKSCLPEI